MGVGGAEGVEERKEHVGDVATGQRAAPVGGLGQQLRQGAVAGDELHDEVGVDAEAAVAKQAHDVRVIEGGERGGLLLEAREERRGLRWGGALEVGDLERHAHPDGELDGPVDAAEAAAADDGDDEVAIDEAPDQRVDAGLGDVDVRRGDAVELARGAARGQARRADGAEAVAARALTGELVVDGVALVHRSLVARRARVDQRARTSLRRRSIASCSQQRGSAAGPSRDGRGGGAPAGSRNIALAVRRVLVNGLPVRVPPRREPGVGRWSVAGDERRADGAPRRPEPTHAGPGSTRQARDDITHARRARPEPRRAPCRTTRSPRTPTAPTRGASWSPRSAWRPSRCRWAAARRPIPTATTTRAARPTARCASPTTAASAATTASARASTRA